MGLCLPYKGLKGRISHTAIVTLYILDCNAILSIPSLLHLYVKGLFRQLARLTASSAFRRPSFIRVHRVLRVPNLSPCFTPCFLPCFRPAFMPFFISCFFISLRALHISASSFRPSGCIPSPLAAPPPDSTPAQNESCPGALCTPSVHCLVPPWHSFPQEVPNAEQSHSISSGAVHALPLPISNVESLVLSREF